jgi:hypothetical protein
MDDGDFFRFTVSLDELPAILPIRIMLILELMDALMAVIQICDVV